MTGCRMWTCLLLKHGLTPSLVFSHDHAQAYPCVPTFLRRNWYLCLLSVRVVEVVIRSCRGAHQAHWKVFQVFFVDYGNIAEVSVSDVYRLEDQMLLEVPPQAICVQIQGVDTSVLSRRRFTEAVIDRTVGIQLCKCCSVVITYVSICACWLLCLSSAVRTNFICKCRKIVPLGKFKQIWFLLKIRNLFCP